ncbi:MAG: phosphoglycolate phosphatase-like HAD superfamily hydrolase [Myxococcota bacterium]|jgi:phosphoglycolate phosphatase-like HAD superfamily hydrolase
MRHVVWDWNGTLLDDLPLVVESVNVLMYERELTPITAADYTAHYTRPVRVFYERLFGRPVLDDEWAHVDAMFHDHYDAHVAASARLMDGAREAMGSVARAGRTQSLLSMYQHEQLVPLVERFGITDRFTEIQGLTGPGGGHKQPHLEFHLALEAHLHAADDPSQVLIIGDTLDDARAARHIGAQAVLLASGSAPRSVLETAGVPVVDTLAEALEAGGLV